MDIATAMTIAANVPSGSPPYYTACTLCNVRQMDPHGYSFSLNGLQNWQVVIVEQVLGLAIQQIIKVGA